MSRPKNKKNLHGFFRSQRGELQDVSFPFVVNMDTASAVAQEMMQSRIIESEDMLIVASKISDLVDAHSARSVNLSSIPGNQLKKSHFEILKL